MLTAFLEDVAVSAWVWDAHAVLVGANRAAARWERDHQHAPIPIEAPSPKLLHSVLGTSVASLVLTDAGEHIGWLTLAWPAASSRRAALDALLAAVPGPGASAYQARLLEALRAGTSLELRPDPRSLPYAPEIDAASFHHSTEYHHDGGGDFYELVPAPSGWNLVLGDVAGKDAVASTTAAFAQQSGRVAARLAASPSQSLRVMHQALVEDAPSDRHCTALVAQITPLAGGLACRLALAGHPPPVLLRGGELLRIGTPGIALGWFDAPYEEEEFLLAHGDVLVCFTDGLSEHRGTTGRMFEDHRLEEILSSLAGASAQEVVAALRAGLSAWGEPLQDDTVIVALRAAPPTP